MNISEAHDFNQVMRYLLDIPRPYATRDPDAAKAAAVRLSERAYKALTNGLFPEQIAKAWPMPNRNRKASQSPTPTGSKSQAQGRRRRTPGRSKP